METECRLLHCVDEILCALYKHMETECRLVHSVDETLCALYKHNYGDRMSSVTLRR